LYSLGFWAEAASHSSSEQNDGIQSAENEILPWLERIEEGSPDVPNFFRNFHRIVVVDSLKMPAFSRPRLEGLLMPEREWETAHLKITAYVPK